ncbi:MAG TPA: hypothetical protein VMW27_29020 [Thermoanaerobaculia bacterium]|nr:hypothetical protein [Thermoanaerobaculia bacterium]
MWSPRRLLLLICAVLAAAPAVFAQETGVQVRLVAPQAGATLTAGETAELEWAPLAGFDRLSAVEEWEAFLSLDGGSTYPVRITPHLDQDLRRVQWQVPPFPTEDARLLLRFGDEHRETAVELPARFAIAAPPAALPGLGAMLAFAARSATRGEPALPGHAGVVAWMEGSRRGGAMRQRLADEPMGLMPRFAFPAAHVEALDAPPPGTESTQTGPAQRAVAVLSASPPRTRTRDIPRPLPGADILLLIQRQNE